MEEKNTPEEYSAAPIEPVNVSTDAAAILKTPIPVLTNYIPDGVPPTIRINQQLQGDFNTGPTPNPRARSQSDSKSYVKALTDSLKNLDHTKDRYSYSRPSSFGAGYKNMNFERYYSHPLYKELGFSPYRNNEIIYNEKSSWWDDFQRALMPTMNGLLVGFKSALPGSSLWGDPDYWNEELEKNMAVGTSNRGGVGGWITNFGLNSAYSVGILGEIAVEALVLSRLKGGASFENISKNIGKLPTTFENIISGSGKVGSAINSTYEIVKKARNIDNAKDIYNVAKDVKSAVGKFINPFEQTTELVSAAVKGNTAWNNLSNYAKMSKSFGAFYNDLRQIDLAFSEALLEGAGAKAQHIQNRLDRYYDIHNELPTGKDADEIYDSAESVNFNTVMLNAGLIYGTNKFVFEDLFNRNRVSFGKDPSFVKGDKRAFVSTPAKEFKVGQTQAVKAVEDASKWSVKGTLKKAFLESSYNPISLKYFTKNIGEALQEVGQESISKGMLEYERRRLEDPNYSTAHSWLSSMAYGMGEQLSLEGLNVFAQGYLTGGLLGGLQGGLTKGLDFAERIGKDRATIEKEKTDRQNRIQEQNNSRINAVNFLADNIFTLNKNSKIENSVNSIVTTKEAQQARENGDLKTEKDLSFEAENSHLWTLASSNSVNLLTDHLNNMLNLDDKSFAEAYNLNETEVGSSREFLRGYIDKANNFKRKYDFLRKELPNPEQPWTLNKDDDPEAYKDSVNRYLGWEDGIKHFLFNMEAAEDTASRMSSIIDTIGNKSGFFKGLYTGFKNGKPFSEVDVEDITSLLDVDQRRSKKQALTGQIEILKTGTDEQKKQAEYLKTQLDFLNEWDQMADHHERIIGQANQSTYSPVEMKRRENYLKFRKGTEVENRKTKEKYTIVETKSDGSAIIKDSKGNLKTINRFNAARIYEVTKESALPKEYAGMGDDVTESLSYMYDAYEKYMRHIGKMNDVEVMDVALNKAFDMIKDFYYLDNDRRALAKSVNILSDPNYFKRYSEIRSNIRKELDNRRAESVLKGFKKSEEIDDKNTLLSKLFDLGVFVPEDEIAYLLNNDLRGEKLNGGVYRGLNFYDTVNKKLVPFDSDKYKKILELIEEYEEKNKVKVLGKRTTEEKVAIKIFGLEKSDEDQRTLKDLAEQFGFDSTKDSSEVSIHELIKAVVDSNYLNELSTIGRAEITLLKRFLTVIPSDAKVTFVKNLESMSKYDPSTRELFIDPRYAAYDYMSATGYPIELAITQALVTKVATERVLQNVEANNRITELREKTIEFLKANKTINDNIKAFISLDQTFTDNAAFVAEAMMNGELQKVLGSIKLDKVERPSVWKEFINQIKKFLAETFGIDANSTVLEAVQEIFGAGLEQVSLPKTEVKSTTEQKKTAQVTTATSINDMDIDLLSDLISAYRKEFEGEAVFPSAEASNDEIFGSKKFEDFVKSSGSAAEIINNYNQGKTEVSEKPKPVSSIPLKTPRFAVNDNIEFTGVAYTTDGTLVEFTNEPFTVKSILARQYDTDQERNVQYVRMENSEGVLFEFDFLGPDEYTVDVVKKPTSKGPEVTTASTPERGRKQLDKAFEKLEEAEKIEDENERTLAQLNAINTIERNVAQGAVLTKTESQKIERLKNKALANGYEVPELLGKSFHPGMKITIIRSVPDETLEEGAEVITEIVTPQINKDDKMIQTAQVVVSVGGKKPDAKGPEVVPSAEPIKPKEEPSVESKEPIAFESVDEVFVELDEIDNLEQLTNWENKLVFSAITLELPFLIENNFNDPEFVDYMVNEKKEELAKRLEFNDLQENVVVWTKDGKLMAVMSNDGNNVVLRPASNSVTSDDATNMRELTKKNFKNKENGIMYKANESLDVVLEQQKEITPEDKQASNEVVSSMAEDDMSADERYEYVKTKSLAEIEQESFDILTSCKV